MDEIGKSLSSPVWWLTSGLMAFAMSLLAYYVGPRLESILSFVSKKARLRSQRKRAEDRAAVERLVNSEFRQLRLWLHTLYGELLALKMIVALVLVIVLFNLLERGPEGYKANPSLLSAIVGVGALVALLLAGMHAKGFHNFELLREAWRETRKREAEHGVLPNG